MLTLGCVNPPSSQTSLMSPPYVVTKAELWWRLWQPQLLCGIMAQHWTLQIHTGARVRARLRSEICYHLVANPAHQAPHHWDFSVWLPGEAWLQISPSCSATFCPEDVARCFLFWGKGRSLVFHWYSDISVVTGSTIIVKVNSSGNDFVL